MTDTDVCLRVTIPPPGQEEALIAFFRARFPAVEPEHLQPFCETGEAVLLTASDRPGLQALAREMQASGLEADLVPPPPHLRRERALVGPHPGSPAGRLVVGLNRVVPPAKTATLPISLPAMPPLPPQTGSTSPCPRCSRPQLADVGFCPDCGYQEQEAQPIAQWLQVRLPQGPERKRTIAWAATATGLPIDRLAPAGRNGLTLSISAPPRVLESLINQLTAWGCDVTVEPPPARGSLDGLQARLLIAAIAVGALFFNPSLMRLANRGPMPLLILAGLAWYLLPGLRRWWAGPPPSLALSAVKDLASPIPLALERRLQDALEETRSPSLRPVVSRVVQETAGIYAAIAAADEVSGSLLRETSPQVSAVVEGLLSVVARGRQIELSLQSQSSESLEQERRRLERLRDGTRDEASRQNYARALESNAKALQAHQELRVAGERLASQLLVLLTGLGEVRTRLTLAGVREAGGMQDPGQLSQQLHELQKEARAIDAGLAELFR